MRDKRAVNFAVAECFEKGLASVLMDVDFNVGMKLNEGFEVWRQKQFIDHRCDSDMKGSTGHSGVPHGVIDVIDLTQELQGQII